MLKIGANSELPGSTNQKEVKMLKIKKNTKDLRSLFLTKRVNKKEIIKVSKIYINQNTT